MDSPGFPWMAVGSTLVGLGLLAYPTLWCRRLFLGEMRHSEAWSLRIPLMLAAGFVVLVTPASFVDMGWVILPTSIALISFAYVSVFLSVIKRCCGSSRDGVRAWAGFVLPMVLLAGVIIWASWGHYLQSLHVESIGFAAMRDVALVNFLFLGVIPPVAAALGMTSRLLRKGDPEALSSEEIFGE